MCVLEHERGAPLLRWRGRGSGPESGHWELRAASRYQPARKWGPQSPIHKDLNPAGNLREMGSRFPPEPPDKILAQ